MSLRLRIAGIAGFLLLWAMGCAFAQVPWQNSSPGTRAGGGGGGYTGPGDIVSGATGWWGFRAYNAAYASPGTNKSVNLVRVSDGASCDILIATTGGLGNTANCAGGGTNGQTPATFCASTTCGIAILYDQSGNGRNMTSISGQRFAITLSCKGTLPCITYAGGSSDLISATIPSLSQPYTFSAVAIRTGAFTSQQVIVEAYTGGSNIGSLTFNNAANQLNMYAGANTAVTATDSAWHAIQAVFNGASSIGNVDGTETTVSSGTSATETTVYLVARNNFFDGMTGSLAEAGIWPSGLSSGSRSSMCHNQFVYYGTATSC